MRIGRGDLRLLRFRLRAFDAREQESRSTVSETARFRRPTVRSRSAPQDSGALGRRKAPR